MKYPLRIALYLLACLLLVASVMVYLGTQAAIVLTEADLSAAIATKLPLTLKRSHGSLTLTEVTPLLEPSGIRIQVSGTAVALGKTLPLSQVKLPGHLRYADGSLFFSVDALPFAVLQPAKVFVDQVLAQHPVYKLNHSAAEKLSAAVVREVTVEEGRLAVHLGNSSSLAKIAGGGLLIGLALLMIFPMALARDEKTAAAIPESDAAPSAEKPTDSAGADVLISGAKVVGEVADKAWTASILGGLASIFWWS